MVTTYRKLYTVLTIAIFAIAGCSGLQIEGENEQAWAEFGVKQVARSIGYYVGTQNDSQLEQLVADSYTLLVKGELDPGLLGLAIDELNVTHPLVASAAIDALDLMGASVIGGDIGGIDQLDPELLAVAENAYSQGLLMGKADVAR